jgi:hypothetical protein
MKHRRGEPAGSFANVIEIPQHIHLNSATSRKIALKSNGLAACRAAPAATFRFWEKVTPSGDFGRVSAGRSAPPAVWCTAGIA